MSDMEKKAKGELGPARDDSIDNGVFGDDHEAMNERITALEKDMAAVKTELAVIRSNYVTREDLAREFGSLRADMAKMETNIIKWFIATAVTIAGLSFAAGRFIH